MPGKPLKDTDFLYATMRVRAMERDLLNRERMERMIEARSNEDAVKVLYECGYAEMNAVTVSECERVIALRRDEVYAIMAKLVGRRELTDVFKLRYDYHNVKALIKAEATGEDASAMLVEAGRMDVQHMKEAMRDQKYNELPGELKRVVAEARDVLSRTADPQVSDFLLDGVCLKEMQAAAEESGSAFLREYVRLFIDVYNLRAVVRTVRLGREPDFLRTVLAGGGNVSASRLVTAVTAGNSLDELYACTPLSEAAAAGAVAARGESSLTEFERLTDNALIRQLSSARHVAFGEQPVVAYLAVMEAEFTAIRTILAGRLAGLAPEALRERLRDGYGL